MKRVGIFGGAFDPPHLAHRALAQAALDQFALDQLRIIPTGQAWHKGRDLTAAEHRVAMVQRAFADLPKVCVDPQELQRPGASYTVDTLTALQRELPSAQFWLFIGADQAQTFTQWHRWSEILQLAQLVVAQRANASQTQAQWHNEALRNALQLSMPRMDVSATAIREALGQSPDTVTTQTVQGLHPKVRDYIDQHRLYTRYP